MSENGPVADCLLLGREQCKAAIPLATPKWSCFRSVLRTIAELTHMRLPSSDDRALRHNRDQL